MNKPTVFRAQLAIAASLWLTACVSPYAENETPITFTPSQDGTVLIASGILDDRAPDALQLAIEENPAVKTLLLQWVPGSMDDEYNLEAGRIVRAYGLTTVVPKNGLIASGGTDLFLAGVRRQLAKDACIGIHSWADDEHRESGDQLAKDHPVHRLYTSYFREMGIDASFYWYSLKAAGPDEMHWMTVKEQKMFDMAPGSSETDQAKESADHIQSRCEERADRLEEKSLQDA